MEHKTLICWESASAGLETASMPKIIALPTIPHPSAQVGSKKQLFHLVPRPEHTVCSPSRRVSFYKFPFQDDESCCLVVCAVLEAANSASAEAVVLAQIKKSGKLCTCPTPFLRLSRLPRGSRGSGYCIISELSERA